jgi:putative transposase
MSYDPEVHHRRSIRLGGYDYSSAGAYFITVCVEARRCAFGEVDQDAVKLAPAGEIVRAVWCELPQKYAELELDAFILIPNHLHAIIGICPEFVGARSPRPPSLGTIMGFFKYESTKRVNTGFGTPGAKLWQRSYYDHVIRGNRLLDLIREYIETNPRRWALDTENPHATGNDDVQSWVRKLDLLAQQKGGETPPLQR